MASWCDHPASKAICKYGVPAANFYCAYCGSGALESPLEHSQEAFDRPARLYNPELDEDPDNRPYVWDLPEGNCTCH